LLTTNHNANDFFTDYIDHFAEDLAEALVNIQDNPVDIDRVSRNSIFLKSFRMKLGKAREGPKLIAGIRNNANEAGKDAEGEEENQHEDTDADDDTMGGGATETKCKSSGDRGRTSGAEVSGGTGGTGRGTGLDSNDDAMGGGAANHRGSGSGGGRASSKGKRGTRETGTGGAEAGIGGAGSSSDGTSSSKDSGLDRPRRKRKHAKPLTSSNSNKQAGKYIKLVYK
jgi:hypothetical protein